MYLVDETGAEMGGFRFECSNGGWNGWVFVLKWVCLGRLKRVGLGAHMGDEMGSIYSRDNLHVDFLTIVPLLVMSNEQHLDLYYTWPLALPCYGIVTVATIFMVYISLNFMETPSPTSLNSICSFGYIKEQTKVRWPELFVKVDSSLEDLTCQYGYEAFSKSRSKWVITS
ncbi:hypothetical protein Tco_0485052 [Tanacetum coccineum]